MFLITGHPRSGTNFTKFLLNGAGIPVESEWYGRRKPLRDDPTVRGVVSWRHVRLFDGMFGVVLHQVRHPLKVIGSSQTLTNDSFRMMFRHTGAPRIWRAQLHLRRYLHGLNERNLLRWSMYTWLRWNEMIEADPRVVFRYRVEEIGSVWEELLERAGVPVCPMPALERTVNTRKDKYRPVTWDELERLDGSLADAVRLKASRYGYATD